MNVLLCASCGTRLTEPVRQLAAMPPYPGWDGLPGPDGRRHGPPSVARGTFVVDPLPFGAPFEPIGPDEEYDGVVPGGRWKSDERGFLVSAGPCGTYVLHPDDVVDIAPQPQTRLTPAPPSGPQQPMSRYGSGGGAMSTTSTGSRT
ncbi:hypothetical protein ACQF36_05400 [Streptomyces sp. Marseille-Q5077]|uniref:hypothetical protein n=1 Tax=Streptomyces sp. Marseille-Q5077 TaxID=3418995 RepID=UPI003D08D625